MIISIFISIFAFVLMFLFVILGDSYIPETRNALMFYLNTIFPTMFPFYVLSSIIVSSKSISTLTRPLQGITKHYNLPSETSCAILLGLICGFPIGAKVTCDLEKNNLITKKEAAILAAFTNNASPIFLISVVGRLYLKNVLYGLIIWLCIVISSLLTGLLLSKIFLNKYNPADNICSNKTVVQNKYSLNLSDSIVSGFNTSLYVGAVIIFFSSITALIKTIPFLKNKIFILIYSILEMNGGLKSIIDNIAGNFSFCSYLAIIAVISWSGICVHMQICGILKTNGIKLKYYYIGKFLQCPLAIIIFYIFLKTLL